MYTESFILFLILLYFVTIRTSYLIVKVMSGSRRKEQKKNENDKVKSLFVIGSGGHTSEMLMLVSRLNPNRYCPRTYIMSETDKWSEQRIITTEDIFAKENRGCDYDYFIVKIPRSREVHQSYLTSVFSTLYSTFYSIPVMLKMRPDIILCNGPGTCVPICVVAFLLRVFFLSNNRIVFIESICRVENLSLTGKILLFIADEILVQWPELKKTYPRTKYIGRL